MLQIELRPSWFPSIFIVIIWVHVDQNQFTGRNQKISSLDETKLLGQWNDVLRHEARDVKEGV